jgi:UDP-N-acetylglucosamine 2-epimerase
VHPRTAATLERIGRRPGITYVDPLGYPQMVAMVRRCRALLTDSGGLQEEAAVLGTPTFILRNETEWTEFVDAGRHRLVGVDPVAIVDAVRDADARGDLAGRMREPLGLERSGAAQRVMDALRELHDRSEGDGPWTAATSGSPVACPGDVVLAAASARRTEGHR